MSEAMEALLLKDYEAAAMVGISRRTWWTWFRSGKTPPAVQRGQGYTRWPRESVLQWIKMGLPAREQFLQKTRAAG